MNLKKLDFEVIEEPDEYGTTLRIVFKKPGLEDVTVEVDYIWHIDEIVDYEISRVCYGEEVLTEDLVELIEDVLKEKGYLQIGG